MPPRPLQDDLEFDPLDPHASTRVAPRGTLAGAEEEPAPPEEASLPPVDRQAATKVVARPVARVVAAPLKLDFSDVLGKSKEVASAQRIGARELEMGDFQSKYEKEALERAKAAPKYDMPTSLQDEDRNQALRVVEKRGSVLLRAVLVILVPAVLALGGAFVYYNWTTRGSSEQLDKLKKADEIHRKAALEHEKEMAR